jgi:hypothetical protein
MHLMWTMVRGYAIKFSLDHLLEQELPTRLYERIPAPKIDIILSRSKKVIDGQIEFSRSDVS